VTQETPRSPTINVSEIKGYVYGLPPKTKTKLVKIVGDKRTINCKMNNQEVRALWDTGAQVCLLSHGYLKENFPTQIIKSVEELILNAIKLTSASGDLIPFKGWTEMTFQLGEGQTVQVPFLVTDSDNLRGLFGNY
jgi:hypothetical protein